MLLNGFVLGTATYAGWVTIFFKFPEKVKNWCAEHSIVPDLLYTFATYLVLGDTLVALLAAAYVGLLFEATMFLYRNREDLDFMYAYKERAKSWVERAKDWMREKNKEYLDSLESMGPTIEGSTS